MRRTTDQHNSNSLNEPRAYLCLLCSITVEHRTIRQTSDLTRTASHSFQGGVCVCVVCVYLDSQSHVTCRAEYAEVAQVLIEQASLQQAGGASDLARRKQTRCKVLLYFASKTQPSALRASAILFTSAAAVPPSVALHGSRDSQTKGCLHQEYKLYANRGNGMESSNGRHVFKNEKSNVSLVHVISSRFSIYVSPVKCFTLYLVFAALSLYPVRATCTAH